MNFERFSSSGLAWSRADDLTMKSYVCRVVWRPRYTCDPQPFLVEWTTPLALEIEDGEADEPASWMQIAA